MPLPPPQSPAVHRSGASPVPPATTGSGIPVIAPPVEPARLEVAALAGALALATLTAGWLVWPARGPAPLLTSPSAFAAMLPFASQLLAALFALWAALGADLDRATRRSWQAMAAAMLVLALGTVFEVAALRHGHDTQALRNVALATLLAQPLLLVALLRQPDAPRGAAARQKYVLDVATILGGGLLVGWYDLRRPLVDGITVPMTDLVTAHTAVTLDLVLLLTASLVWRRTHLRRRSVVLLALASGLLLSFVNDIAALVMLHRTGTRPDWLHASASLFAGAVALAAWWQRFGPGRAIGRDVGGTRMARGGISAIPFVAIVPGFALLLIAAAESGVQPLTGLALGAVLLTTLAFMRHLVAARETAVVLAEAATRESEARFRALVQHSSDVITILDPDGTVRYLSPSAQVVFGLDPARVVGGSFAALLHPDDAAGAQRFLADLAAAAPDDVRWPRTREWRLAHADGRWLTVDNVGTNLLAEPVVQGLVLNSRDVTERRQMEEQYMHQAFHDPLTDLANRSLFLYQVGHALARGARHHDVVSVLFLDLDNFKTVNDSLGHAAGDRLLVEAARRLSACVRDSDLIARLGGDEFAVLVESTAIEAEVLALAERIVESIARPFTLGGKEVFVSASVGVARTAPGASADELVRNADVAMYIAKTRGKGRVVRFEPDMHAAALERLDLEADLRRAVDRHEFFLEYQPIVALAAGEVCGAEALVRWQRSGRGAVPPSVFIPVAEETGLIVDIGRHVLREACRQGRRWRDEHGTPIRMTVNLSGRQLQDPSIVHDVRDALATTGFTARDLVLEITESILMQHVEVSIERLSELKALGVSLAIDDFGTGYSSLSYLQRYPIDILKIDKAFVDTLESGDDGTVLASAIVALGDTLRLDTVAEGIETEAQRGALLEIGCAFGQGFLFSPPLGPDDFGVLMRVRGTRAGETLRRRHVANATT